MILCLGKYRDSYRDEITNIDKNKGYKSNLTCRSRIRMCFLWEDQGVMLEHNVSSVGNMNVGVILVFVTF